ncbi:hypothetical protein [Aeromonas veronii]|uniref:hypothetical protein n=1 Tax=Aeromonas veronii TaxID=654 RepID=UPI00224547BE|nr:hypothetical protein [Aeromonas veronii]MCX0445450.1 hypothetical protein [Aeromonas veronii]
MAHDQHNTSTAASDDHENLDAPNETQQPGSVRSWEGGKTTGIKQTGKNQQKRSALNAVQQWLITELRRVFYLSLDDLLDLAKAHIAPTLSRSALDRLLNQYGLSDVKSLMPQFNGKIQKGVVQLTIIRLPRLSIDTSDYYLYSALELSSRWAFIKILNGNKPQSTINFIENIFNNTPFRISTIYTGKNKVCSHAVSFNDFKISKKKVDGLSLKNDFMFEPITIPDLIEREKLEELYAEFSDAIIHAQDDISWDEFSSQLSKIQEDYNITPQKKLRGSSPLDIAERNLKSLKKVPIETENDINTTKSNRYLSFIHTLYDALGLYEGIRRKDIIERNSYNAHQSFFKKYHAYIISALLLNDSDLLRGPREDLFWTYENIYYLLTKRTIPFNISESELDYALIMGVIIPIAAIDIFEMLDTDNSKTINYHFDKFLRFLTSDIGSEDEDEDEEFYSIITLEKKYLTKCVKELGLLRLADIKDAQQGLYSTQHYINTISIGNNKRLSSIRSTINTVKYSVTLFNKENSESPKINLDNIDTLLSAMYALRIFHYFENKVRETFSDYNKQETSISIIYHLSDYYSQVVSPDLLNYGVSHDLSMQSMTSNLISLCSRSDLIHNPDFDEIAKRAVNALYLNVLKQINNNAPPVSSPSLIEFLDYIFSPYHPNKIVKDINISDIFSSDLRIKEHDMLGQQYLAIIDVLREIKSNHLISAQALLKKIKDVTLPSFGILKYAVAVLKVGLKIKIGYRSIKNLSLSDEVNTILTYQGTTLPYIKAVQLDNNEQEKLFTPYNTAILCSILQYNLVCKRLMPTIDRPTQAITEMFDKYINVIQSKDMDEHKASLLFPLINVDLKCCLANIEALNFYLKYPT